MQDGYNAFLSLALLLAIISCGASLILSPFSSKKGMDPLMLLRPIVKWAIRVPVRILRTVTPALRRWTLASWRQAGRTGTSTVQSVLLYIMAVVTGLGYAILAIPQVIIGGGGKKK